MATSGIRGGLFIDVCSRNPVAIWAISNLLVQSSLTYRISQSFSTPLAIVSKGVHIALFDVSSVPEWLELIPKWTASRYKPILLVSQYWGWGGVQLRALHSGVVGIVHVTNNLGDQLLNAITLVASGQLFVTEETLSNRHSESQFPGACAVASHLSFREEQVLGLLMLGFPNKKIGTVLGISERTAKFHVGNILHKLRVGSRRELQTMDRNILGKAEPASAIKIVCRSVLSG